MKTIVSASLVLLATLAAGCVSKSQFESVQAQLTQCQQDKQAAQDAAASFEKHMSADSARWDALKGELGSVLPELRQDFETERQRIISMVPEQVQAQVGHRLDRHFAKISADILAMNTTMEGLRTQLDEARAQIAKVQETTEAVGTKVDETQTTLASDTARLNGIIGEQRKRANELVSKVTAFDTKYLTCETCAERLKMKDRSREQLLALHADVVKGLSTLQSAGQSM